jgi:hypothetical protein
MKNHFFIVSSSKGVPIFANAHQTTLCNRLKLNERGKETRKKIQNTSKGLQDCRTTRLQDYKTAGL